jgi:hypothetical protein
MTRILPSSTWLLTFVALSIGGLARAEDPVFSGPQVGEKLVPFKVRAVLGGSSTDDGGESTADSAADELDLVSAADGKPLVILFVHEATRPSIGLMRTVMNYAQEWEKDGLTSGVVFLADDATEAEAFIKRASHAMPRGVPIGISLDGQEGPGAYGLNRKVTLTVLVAKDNVVTANFALVQPSLPQDAPEIGHAIAKVLGSDKRPTLAEMGGEQAAMVRRGAVDDDTFRSLLAPVIRQNATQEQVDAAAQKVEARAAKDDAFKKRVAEVANRIIDAGRLDNYGTSAAREYLRKWAKEYSDQDADRKSENEGEEQPAADENGSE